MSLTALYSNHIKNLLQQYQQLLQKYDYDYLIVAAGEPRYVYLDDMPYPFKPNAQFKAILPLINHPDSFVIIPQTGKPSVIYYQPFDYWHSVPEEPQGYWTEHFDINITRTPADAINYFPKDLTSTAFLGEQPSYLNDSKFEKNPENLINEIHWLRAYKSEYELACLKEASRLGAKAHLAAKDAFYAGESELGIHYTYLKAAQVTEAELPYNNIIALNENAAILHYTEYSSNTLPEKELRSFLIDAGGSFNGYASDITRTYAYNPKDEFAELIQAMDEMQLDIIASIPNYNSYIELHKLTHFKIAEILNRFDFIKMAPESIVETQISNVFLPHGLGHFLGLQVHDIGGKQTSPEGDTTLPPAPHIYLRNTRPIEPRQYFTIEPGLYFIEMLLKEHRDSKNQKAFNWDKIEAFKPYGGIRIEDNVLVTASGTKNYTRKAFAEL